MTSTIAATLIVRDAETTIRRCIASVRPHVDHVTIVDTGSTDRTLRILRKLARDPAVAPITVHEREWEDSYSVARNQALELAPDVEWLLWLDADDELDDGRRLRQLATRAPSYVIALSFRYDYGAPGFPLHAFKPFLLRRSSVWRFEGRCHERIAAVYPGFVEQLPPHVARVRHLRGQPERMLHPRRLHEHRRLLLLDLRECLGGAYVPAGLAANAIDRLEADEAREWLRLALAHPSCNPEVRAAVAAMHDRIDALIATGRRFRQRQEPAA